MTEEQELELWILMMWGEAWRLEEDTLIWLAESYPKYFEIENKVFRLKKFESSFY